jgi:ketosteroid isomerase-like protein
MTISNAEQVRRGWEAVQRGDFDVITEMLDPEVKWHGGDPSAAGACQNRNQAVAFMKAVWAGRPQAQLVDVKEAGDKVVLVLRRGMDDAGEPELVANLTSFRDGKVVEMVHYEDPDEALAAAGLRA